MLHSCKRSIGVQLAALTDHRTVAELDQPQSCEKDMQPLSPLEKNESFHLPHERVPLKLVIGKSGENIREIKELLNVTIRLDQQQEGNLASKLTIGDRIIRHGDDGCFDQEIVHHPRKFSVWTGVVELVFHAPSRLFCVWQSAWTKVTT